jgi:uncharacterized metal-binding protein
LSWLLLTRSAMARENLHRAELNVQERLEHIAEWTRLADQAAIQERVRNRAIDLALIIEELRAAGCDTSELLLDPNDLVDAFVNSAGQ